jgi:CheY-like chemotaxis protein
VQPASCRVLVVDDDRDTRDSFALLLRLWGHDVRTAADGPMALTAAADFQPQAILLDIGLPRLDGWEVARRLRGLTRATLIGVSGFGRDVDRERARRDGWDHFLLKPVEPAELERLLEVTAAECRPMPAAECRVKPGEARAGYGLSELATSLRSGQLARRAAELRAKVRVLRAKSESLLLRFEATMSLVGRWLSANPPKRRG